MSESDSIKKLIMDLASQIALTEHLDTVRFCLQPSEYSYGDYISVTFYKGQQAVGNLFPIDEFLKIKSDFRLLAYINTYLATMVNKLNGGGNKNG